MPRPVKDGHAYVRLKWQLNGLGSWRGLSDAEADELIKERVTKLRIDLIRRLTVKTIVWPINGRLSDFRLLDDTHLCRLLTKAECETNSGLFADLFPHRRTYSAQRWFDQATAPYMRRHVGRTARGGRTVRHKCEWWQVMATYSDVLQLWRERTRDPRETEAEAEDNIYE